MTWKNTIFAFLVGAVLYPLMEIAFRGWTHWTMSLLGGLCFAAVYWIHRSLDHYPLLLQALAGGAVITELEFITGMLVNRLMQWQVWDYSREPMNVAGQISLRFSLLWCALSFVGVWIISRIEAWQGLRGSA